MKKFIFVFLLYLYIFFVLGLIFHTSAHATVFGKYTLGYFIFLILLTLFFWPYLFFLRFSGKTSSLKISKRKIILTPLFKMGVYLFLLLILFIAVELLLRYRNIEYGIPAEQSEYSRYAPEDLHPFLQHQNSKVDNVKDEDLHINSFGFRGDEIQRIKPKGVYRIFVLGGSTVFNRYTPFEQSFPRVLEKMLNNYSRNKKIEVQNAGVEGYTTQHSIIQYEFKIRDFKPDMIIVLQGINDMDYSCTPELFTRGPYEDDYSHWFGSLSNMIKTYYAPRPMINFISFDYIRHFFTSSLYSDFSKTTKALKPPGQAIDFNFQSIGTYKKNLEYFVKLASADGVKLVFANQPFLYNKTIDPKQYWDIQWLCAYQNKYPSIDSIIKGANEFNNVIKSVAEENDVYFIDAESKLPKNSAYFSDDVHFFPPKANRIVAQTLFDSIIKDRIMEQ